MAKYKTATITLTASGDTQIIAAPGTGKLIQVYALHVQFDATVSAKLKSGTTDLTGPAPQVAGGGWVYPLPGHDPAGQNPWFEGGDNEALKVNLSANANGGGVVLYRIKSVT